MFGSEYIVTVPVVVIRPIDLPLVNQSAPSDPLTIPVGYRMPEPLKFVIAPLVVMRPMELLPSFANHRAPSGPATMPIGLLTVSLLYVVTTPSVPMRPMEPFKEFVNHSAPSGPGVISSGWLIPA